MWKLMAFSNPSLLVSLVLSGGSLGLAQTGTRREPVRYVGETTIDLRPHDGALRPAIGVANHQVLRVNRTRPELADGHGWTYNHAPMLAYWRGRFYQQHLSNPVGEHIAPGQTLVSTSTNGRDWSKPEVVFPPYQPPKGTPMPKRSKGYMMHQRMGFYVAPNKRLLVLGFYGHAPNPFREGGIGRVVREAHADGGYGPIYFVRYSSHTDWNESNTSYPFYTRSTDKGFVDACNALLADKLMTLQWRDEDRGLDGFYTVKRGGSALSFYHRKDGNVVALWKRSTCAISLDEGATFSVPVRVPTLVMAGGKVWGQRTDDGRYALVYNPTKHDEHRYPLVIVTGDDGITFDNMLVVHGEVPPRRYYGKHKDFGPQYVRGIAEGNGNPPGDDMWITYSVNKEDIWISRIPVPVRWRVEQPVRDTFDDMDAGGNVADWNVYAPVWAPVRVAEFPSATHKSLRLEDKDPYDYARAVRVFREGRAVKVRWKVLAKQNDRGALEIDIADRYGNRPVRLRLADDGQIWATKGARPVALQAYKPNAWYTFDATVNAAPQGIYSVSIDGKRVLSEAPFAETVTSVERISFRTGPHRTEPTRRTPNQLPGPDLPNADSPVPSAVFYVDDVQASSQ